MAIDKPSRPSEKDQSVRAPSPYAAAATTAGPGRTDRRTAARYIRIAARGGPASRMAFCASSGSPNVATESTPRAPTAGEGPSGPPSGVDRTAEASSANRSPAWAGNAGSAPPASTSSPSSSRTAAAPTTIASSDATMTGCVPTNEAVRSRRRRWIGSPSSASSIARCSSRIRSAVANQRGDRRPADSMKRRNARSPTRRAFWTRRRRTSVPGRCARFHHQAAATSRASSNRRPSER